MSVQAPISATQFADGDAVLVRPFVYQLELTNHCPYACTGCPRQTMHRPLGFMSTVTYQR